MNGSTRLATLAIVPVVIAATAAAAGPGDGLRGSRHDFTDEVPTVGLCTFCHTPHKAISTPLIWNHSLSAETYSWSDPGTTAGTSYPRFNGDSYAGASTRCLSCHDGTVAIGDIAWYDTGDPGTLYAEKLNDPGDPYRIAQASDMSENHPVAMPYPFARQPSTYNGVRTGDAADLQDWQPDPTTTGIRLFSDDDSGVIAVGPIPGRTGIECSSCHDPHNMKVEDEHFLRGSLDGGSDRYLCRKCHLK
ncbi:MAG: hypothetical protein HYV63_29545 [Candidatus Schekmanbacteria bacterium]|nr:hypothetical protein [Candidatus Schekmanbacteria bacterium]